MKICLLPLALVTVALAGPSSAQTWTAEKVSLQQSCYAEANAIDFSGEKAGYAASYRAAVAACLSRVGTGRYQGYNPPKHRAVANVQGDCPPGAPILYRGTLYCTR